MRIAALTALCSLAMPVMAGGLSLQQPIDCVLGETCFIQQFVDQDAGPGAQDFTCGTLSYDGHKGTDFGLISFQAMRDGVNVIAAASGTVLGMRDEMPDTGFGPETSASIQGKECGNGVVIDHGDGWQTQYCHMKRGTIQVQRGQQVTVGTLLGQVGFSGRTQFPHLHLSVRQNRKVVDPFDPDGQITCGAPDSKTLWAKKLPYTPGGILNAGFLTSVPEFEDIKQTGPRLDTIQPDAPALVLWGYAFGSRAGDELMLEIVGPEGPFLMRPIVLDRTQAQLFRAIGKRGPSNGFATGQYSGRITLSRAGKIIDEISVQTVVR